MSKICPLRKDNSDDTFSEFLPCYKEKCSWWCKDLKGGQCAILKLATKNFQINSHTN